MNFLNRNFRKLRRSVLVILRKEKENCGGEIPASDNFFHIKEYLNWMRMLTNDKMIGKCKK